MGWEENLWWPYRIYYVPILDYNFYKIMAIYNWILRMFHFSRYPDNLSLLLYILQCLVGYGVYNLIFFIGTLLFKLLTNVWRFVKKYRKSFDYVYFLVFQMAEQWKALTNKWVHVVRLVNCIINSWSQTMWKIYFCEAQKQTALESLH